MKMEAIPKTLFNCERLRNGRDSFSAKNVATQALLRFRAFSACGLVSPLARSFSLRIVFLGWLRFLLTLVLVVLLAGCANLGVYNAATGKREFIFIPTEQEVELGKDVHKQVSSKYKFLLDAETVKRVRDIGQRVAQLSDRQDYEYQFYLVENEELNAFTSPGGNVYIFTGLLNKLSSDDEIAAVLAHEIGHCSAKHVVKKFQAAAGYDLVGRLIFNHIGEGQAARLAAISSNVAMDLVFSAYSRKDEYEADRLGLKYMHLAGYDVSGMIKVLEILNEESKGSEGVLILRSHPYLKDRIVAVKEEIEQLD